MEFTVMLLFSKKIIRFAKEIKGIIKEILSKEIFFKVAGNRFYDRGASYPIKVVIYNNQSMLGYFNSDFYELGFHERLMHVKREQLYNVIRHELAHYITFINFGETAKPHSVEFKAFCLGMGWGEEVYRATICLEANHSIEEEGAVLRKVQKLMALSTSSNTHEAEMAMIKSQQLLLKHNLESRYSEEEEKFLLKRIMKQKRSDGKMDAIGHILETFFVTIVYNRTEEFTYLEILGSAVNVEIAEYVANVLNLELDRLWHQAQKESLLKGKVAKNSFFRGLAKGYCHKVQVLNLEVGNALMVIEKKLSEAKAMAYGRLSSGRSSAAYCREASTVGERMGRQLNINPALNRSSGPLLFIEAGKAGRN